ncbi:MAG: phosphotransferase [Anaerolineae bacterium]|nr:phosphotransferase [Anaerolineae bacterium]
MTLGAQIAQGRTADIHLWGDDGTQVIKLPRPGFNNSQIEYEAQIAEAVHAVGVPMPAPLGLVQVGERKGLIYERIKGMSLGQWIAARPYRLFNGARRLASLHYQIHQQRTTALPSQRERLLRTIDQVDVSAEIKRETLEVLAMLPDDQIVCHGDFHLENVLLTETGAVTIDWIDAVHGNPLGDVARSVIIFTLVGSESGFRGWAVRQIQRTYVNHYLKLSGRHRAELQQWLIPCAVSRLTENLEGSYEILVPLIEQWLKNTR